MNKPIIKKNILIVLFMIALILTILAIHKEYESKRTIKIIDDYYDRIIIEENIQCADGQSSKECIDSFINKIQQG